MSNKPEENTFRKSIYERMNLKETDELLAIWRKGNHEEWTEMALDVVKEILLERLGEIPSEEEKRDIGSATLSLPTQDERVMASLSHITAILPFMGMIAPIVIWVTQKEKSKYVAFHALQALGFQLSMVVAWFIAMGCYIASFFATFLSIPFASSSTIAQSNQPLFGSAFLVPFVVFGAMFIGEFALIVYGIIGAIMTFQGKPFRYVFIGNQVERFLAPK